MAKTKTPFFSLGAHGSVGEAITAQKRGLATLMRSKPLPTDPYSLPQAYQRWYYQDVAYRWTQQSAATQAEYRSAGVRHHLTGFQYWMKVQLPLYTNIITWLTLDEKGGAVVYDRTPNALNGTIFGASPASGLINGSYYFDGINDLIDLGTDALLKPADNLCTEFLMYPTITPIDWRVFSRHDHWSLMIWTEFNGRMYMYSGAVRYKWDFNWLAPISGRWTHVLITFQEGIGIRIWENAQELVVTNVNNYTNGYLTNPYRLQIGAHTHPNSKYFEGYIDNFIHQHAIPDQATITRHSLRRYP